MNTPTVDMELLSAFYEKIKLHNRTHHIFMEEDNCISFKMAEKLRAHRDEKGPVSAVPSAVPSGPDLTPCFELNSKSEKEKTDEELILDLKFSFVVADCQWKKTQVESQVVAKHLGITIDPRVDWCSIKTANKILGGLNEEPSSPSYV